MGVGRDLPPSRMQKPSHFIARIYPPSYTPASSLNLSPFLEIGDPNKHLGSRAQSASSRAPSSVARRMKEPRLMIINREERSSEK